MDPVLHAEMTMLVREEKELEEERAKLDPEVWAKRVRMAEEKGMIELADEARERFKVVNARHAEISLRLEVIEMEKSSLRYESKRPSGVELRRAEALLESVRQGGLIDPDEASLDREFADLAKEQSLKDTDIELDFSDEK